MLTYVFQFIRWVFQKFAGGVLIVGLGVVGCGLWLYLHDRIDVDQWRVEAVRNITGERALAKKALEDVQRRMVRIQLEIEAEQDRGKQADKIIAQLHDLESTWDKLTGNTVQRKANDERIATLTATRVEAANKEEKLRQDFTRATWERDGLEVTLGKLDAKMEKVQEEEQSRAMAFADRVWNYELGLGRIVLAVKEWAALALLLYFFGPMVGKIWMYYFLAPWIARSRPIRFQRGLNALPAVSESGPAAALTLRPGERLWIKEGYLQTSDESLQKKSRAVLDPRVPLTCFAAGLTKLVELSNRTDTPSAPLTLSNQSHPSSELAFITLEEGASLVLRPSFLVGVVLSEGQSLRLRRRWQLLRWQAWVNLQFRYFEFSGPCLLVVAGSRGVKAEALAEREGGGFMAGRANQYATMGFTPNLDWRPARAESFFDYYRGLNPLFDNRFAGKGVFLFQKGASGGKGQKARKFWPSLRIGCLKVFGI